jgi:outer membrane lipoprotein-sorting protein
MLRKNKKIFISTVAIGFILFFSCSCLAAISVQEIINNMQKVYEKQMAGINDYTVIQKPTGGVAAMAGETKIYYKKAKVDGGEIYKTRIENEVMGMNMVMIYDGKYNWSKNPMTGEIEKKESEFNPGQMWKNMDLSKTKYLGEEMIDGEKAYILQIDNVMQVMGNPQNFSPQGEETEGSAETSGKLWISSKTWMPVRMVMVMKAGSEGMIMNTTTTTDFKDYRQVVSMLHPFQLVMKTSMEMDTSGMSEEEKEEQEQTLQMMQSMMSGMGSFSIETVDVKVNTGLPDNLFDGTKLK